MVWCGDAGAGDVAVVPADAGKLMKKCMRNGK